MIIWLNSSKTISKGLRKRQQAKEFATEIPLIISKYPDLKVVAEQLSIDYYHISITEDNKQTQEAKQLELLRQYNIDLVVLAKYIHKVKIWSDLFS